MAVSSIESNNNAYKVSETSGMMLEATKKISNEEYLRGLQKQVPYVTLEVGSALSMQRDKRAGVITVNPKLLEKMKKDPEAAVQYTQKFKDIERAERTANAYYNSLGGVVERTSHWYVDEEGNHYHFAYTRRDDRLNKKIREEAKKNMEEHIEKTRAKAREKAEELKEKLEEKLEEAKKEEKGEKTKTDITEAPTVKAEGGEIIENKLTVNEPIVSGMPSLEQRVSSGASLDLEI